MKVAITGGHLSPAIAVIEMLRKKNTKIVFFGRKHSFDNDTATSFEYQTIKKLGIPFIEIKSGKIKRHLSPDFFTSLTKIPKGFKDANQKLKEEKPDILLTFGGFMSVPVAFAAYKQKIPIIIHEQTQYAGLANRLLAKVATKICITFESSQKFFPKKRTVLTGNPIRADIFQVNQKIHLPEGDVIYITGGSTGAHKLNMLVKKTLDELLKLGSVIHQTGDTSLTNDYTNLQDFKKTLPEDIREKYILKKYIQPEELGWIYQKASVVVSRSGINTVLELLATKTVALLIPLQVGQKNEQLNNAKLYAKSGLGEYILQDEITEEKFINLLKTLIKTASERKKNDTLSVKKNATEEIVSIILSIYEEKRKKTA